MVTAKELRESQRRARFAGVRAFLDEGRADRLAEEREEQKHSSIPPNQPAVTITEICAGSGCQIMISVRRKLCETELDFLKDDIAEKVKAFFPDSED